MRLYPLFLMQILIVSLGCSCGEQGQGGGGAQEGSFQFTQSVPLATTPEKISGTFHIALTQIETNCTEEIEKQLPPFLEGTLIVDDQEGGEIFLEIALDETSQLTGKNQGKSAEDIMAEVYGNAMVYSDTKSQSAGGCNYESTSSVVISVDSVDAASTPLTAKFLNGTLLGSFEVNGNCGEVKTQSCKVGYRISGLGIHMKEYLTNTVSNASRFSEMLGFEPPETHQTASEESNSILKMVPKGFLLKLER